MPTARTITFDPPWCVFVTDVSKQLACPVAAVTLRRWLFIAANYYLGSNIISLSSENAQTLLRCCWLFPPVSLSDNYHWWGPPTGKEVSLAFSPTFFSQWILLYISLVLSLPIAMLQELASSSHHFNERHVEGWPPPRVGENYFRSICFKDPGIKLQ